MEVETDAEGFAPVFEFVRGDQVAPVAVPLDLPILAGDERRGLLAREVDHVLRGVSAEALGGVRRRLPVLLSRAEEGHSERLDFETVRDVARRDPELPRALLPEGVGFEHRAGDAETLLPVVEDGLAGRTALDVAFGLGRGQALEAVADVPAHRATSSFAQKNPPVSFWWG
uniref:hypothetical protein n=1 Tax=Halarchaeum acidiphilum TaxID=489138 RepID=UPI000677FB29